MGGMVFVFSIVDISVVVVVVVIVVVVVVDIVNNVPDNCGSNDARCHEGPEVETTTRRG